MPQIKDPDDLQIIRFFVLVTIAFHDGNKQIAWRDDLASAAFNEKRRMFTKSIGTIM